MREKGGKKEKVKYMLVYCPSSSTDIHIGAKGVFS